MMQASCHIGRGGWGWSVFEARAAEFGLQQQPRPAAVTPAAAAPQPPAAAAAAAGDRGNCGAYSVSILRQGGRRLYPESRAEPPTCRTVEFPPSNPESESGRGGRWQEPANTNSDRQASKQLMGPKWYKLVRHWSCFVSLIWR